MADADDGAGQLVDETYHYTGPHLSEYSRTKAEAHHLADQFIAERLPLVIVMPGLIYGPGDTSSVRTTLIQYMQRKLPMIPRQTAFCWAHVDDVARAHILAMEKGKPGDTYVIAGPRHTFVEGMKIAQEITGIPAPKAAPAGMFKAMAAVMGVVEKVLPVPEAYTGEGLRGIAGVTYSGFQLDATSCQQVRPSRRTRLQTAVSRSRNRGRVSFSICHLRFDICHCSENCPMFIEH